MTMELDMKSFVGFEELSNDELEMVNGGFDWGAFATGLGYLASGLVVVASIPVTGPFGLYLAGAIIYGALAGGYFGYALAS
jgi:hypothetical protein